MLRRAIVCLALLLVQPAQAQDGGTLLIVNRDGGSITFFDLPLEVEMARVPIGARIPHEIAVSPDGRRALTSQYGGGGNRGQLLVVLGVESASILGIIDLGAPSRPHSMAFLPDGRRAVATMEDADMLALVDVTDLSVRRTYPTGGREGHMVRISPDGTRAYVTSRGGAGTLSVIYLEEDRAPDVIVTGEGAEGIAVSPDGAEIWVANRRAGTISVVDADTLRVAAEFPSHPMPSRVAFSAAGQALVPNGISTEKVASYLSVIDAASREVLKDFHLGDFPQPGGPAAFGLLVAGSRAFLADQSRRRVLAFSLGDLSASPRVLLAGHDGPDGMAWSPLRVRAPGD